MSETTINLSGTGLSYIIVNDPSGTVVTGGTFGYDSVLVVDGESTKNTFYAPLATLDVNADGISYEDTIKYTSARANISGTASSLSVVEGIAYVENGGSLMFGQDLPSGEVTVYQGGNDYQTTIQGYEGVVGTATGDIIEGLDSAQNVGDGGIVNNSTVSNQGLLRDWSGGTEINALIGYDGFATIFADSILENPTLESGGQLVVESGATTRGTITLENGGIALIPYADVSAQGSTLGTDLLLTGTSLSLTQPTEVTLAPTGVLTVGATAITFAGGGNSVLLETPLASGIEITQGALCFSAGTRIQTPGGEVAVEELEVGDRVSLHDGGHASIKFIGTRSYDGKFIAGRHLALPVTFHKNSIAENIPARDLTVSPGHGMFIDGVIVPAWRLVNGRSVTQAAAVERVDYLHIELANGHGILLAENCPAESYLDIGNRYQFQNAAEFYSRFPGDSVAPASCHPRIESGFLLEAIQNRIAARAGIAIPPRRNGGVRGFVDQAGEDIGSAERVVAGWAQDPTQPEMPVILYIAVDDQPVMRILANQYRADLRAAGLGSGCHGFEVSLPRGMQGRVDVRQAVSGAILPLTEAAAAMEGSPRLLRAGHAA